MGSGGSPPAAVWGLGPRRNTTRDEASELREQASPESGDEGNRTPNPRLAKAVLCQLSYVPWLSGDVTRSAAGDVARVQFLVASCHRSVSREARTLEKMKAPAARATATAMSFFTRSRPNLSRRMSGVELREWAQLDLNQRPRRYQRRALTN